MHEHSRGGSDGSRPAGRTPELETNDLVEKMSQIVTHLLRHGVV